MRDESYVSGKERTIDDVISEQRQREDTKDSVL
jgi:hypothetical protein